MFKVGITGGIGSGKTTVSKVFSALQIPVYDADSKAKLLMQTDADLILAIKSIFGKEAYLENGNLNRGHISKLVFNDKNLLKSLNDVVHPAVKNNFEEWCDTQNAPYVVKEAALLIESGSYKQCDVVLLVTADESLRVQRVALRDNLTPEQVLQRVRNQMPELEKKEKANYIVENNGNSAVLPQIVDLHKQFLKLAKSNNAH